MTYKTHLVSNAAVLSTFAASGTIDYLSFNGLLIICGSIIGSLTPDIDNPRSKVNYISSGLYKGPFTKTYDHRKNLPHWPLFSLFILSSLYLCPRDGTGPDIIGTFPYIGSVIIGIVIGIATHLLTDMFNPRGIMLFAPFSKTRFRFARIPTGSSAEVMFRYISFAIIAIATVVSSFRYVSPQL